MTKTNHRISWRPAASPILAATFGALSLLGQITGHLQVRVADPTDAAVPNAAITVRSLETSTTRTVTTDETGSARVNQLTVGSYEIQVSLTGFNPVTTRVQVDSGGIKTVPVTLAVAAGTQQIEVRENATALNTVNSQLQQTTANQEITDLPLSNTGILGFASISPGVIPVTPNNPFLGLGSYNSNGGRGRANNITLDNAYSTDVSTTGGAGLGTVPLDAIKEFNLITNQFNAEFGRNASSQLQLLTRNGTNNLHGELFELFRNGYLNTRDYFDRTGSSTPNVNHDWALSPAAPLSKTSCSTSARTSRARYADSGVPGSPLCLHPPRWPAPARSRNRSSGPTTCRSAPPARSPKLRRTRPIRSHSRAAWTGTSPTRISSMRALGNSLPMLITRVSRSSTRISHRTGPAHRTVRGTAP